MKLKFGKFTTSDEILQHKEEIDQHYIDIINMKLKLINYKEEWMDTQFWLLILLQKIRIYLTATSQHCPLITDKLSRLFVCRLTRKHVIALIEYFIVILLD